MNREELMQVAKPILFNTEMVKAILDGRKTVTRRVLKLPSYIEQNENGLYTLFADGDCCYENQSMEEVKEYIKPPFKAGDYLYVRETWSEWTDGYLYKAWTSPFRQPGKSSIMRWYPSIHMPKEAARIFLKITDVRVERLQDITEEQALAEGIQAFTKDKKLFKYTVTSDWWIDFHQKHRKIFFGTWWQDMPKTAKEAFSYLWNSTLGRKGTPEYYGNCWKGNPWVWVIEFEKIEAKSYES